MLAGVSPIFRLLRSCRESLKETITCYPLVLMPWAQPGSHLFHFGGESSKIKVPSSRRNGIGLCVGWSLSDLSAAPLLSRKLEGNHHMLSTCPHALGTPGSHLFHFGGESSKIKVPSSRRNGIGLCVGWSLSDLSATPLLSRKLEGNHHMLSTCPHALGTTRLAPFPFWRRAPARSRSPPRGETESASVLAGVSPIFRLLRSCRESLKETITCYPLVLMPWAQPGSHLFHFGGERRKIKAFSSRRNGIGLCVGWSLSDLSATPLLSRKLEGNHHMLSTCPHALGTTRLAPFPFWRRE